MAYADKCIEYVDDGTPNVIRYVSRSPDNDFYVRGPSSRRHVSARRMFSLVVSSHRICTHAHACHSRQRSHEHTACCFPEFQNVEVVSSRHECIMFSYPAVGACDASRCAARIPGHGLRVAEACDMCIPRLQFYVVASL